MISISCISPSLLGFNASDIEISSKPSRGNDFLRTRDVAGGCGGVVRVLDILPVGRLSTTAQGKPASRAPLSLLLRVHGPGRTFGLIGKLKKKKIPSSGLHFQEAQFNISEPDLGTGTFQKASRCFSQG